MLASPQTRGLERSAVSHAMLCKNDDEVYKRQPARPKRALLVMRSISRPYPLSEIDEGSNTGMLAHHGCRVRLWWKYYTPMEGLPCQVFLPNKQGHLIFFNNIEVPTPALGLASWAVCMRRSLIFRYRTTRRSFVYRQVMVRRP